MKLTDHFTLAELTASQIATRRGLLNTPGPAPLANLQRLAKKLEEVRALLQKPVIVLSGFRTEAVNHAVGGAKKSAHIAGRAADIIAPGYGKVMDVFEAIRASGIAYDQLIAEHPASPNGGWIHIAIAEHPRRQALVFDGQRYAEVA